MDNMKLEDKVEIHVKGENMINQLETNLLTKEL